MNTIPNNFEFNPMSYRTATNQIIIHHAAGDCTVARIHEMHKAKGWAGIGYHYVVDKQGNVYDGRPVGAVGAHSYGHNTDSIGVCFIGNYESERKMPAAQKQAGAQLLTDLLEYYGLDYTDVHRHSEYNATACPGKYFPWDEVIYKCETTREHNKVYTFQEAAKNDGFAFPLFGLDGHWGKETEAVAKRAIVQRHMFGYRYPNLTKVVQGIVGAEVDGKCGAKTTEAIKTWQFLHGCKRDGAFGIECWRMWVFNK